MPAFAPQPLASALESIARQAGLQLIYSSSLSNGVGTPGAAAGLTWQDSLRQVLRGTGLTYQLVNEHTVTIIQDPNAQATAAGSADVQPLEGDASRSDRRRAHFSVPQFGDLPLDQVIITGSHISGVAPSGSQVITIGRKQIDRSGYSTVQEVVRALPQNFSGGASDDTRTTLEDLFNSSRGSGLNLRGLGSGSTLVLINGRRLAASGSDGRFVDVSGIPLSAVERIEILPDGASAIYGADAVGGVVNFILRDDYNGAESLLKYGTVTAGAMKSTQLAQLLGDQWDSGSALLSFEYYSRDSLPNADRRQSRNSDLTSLGGQNFDETEGNPGTLVWGPVTWALPRGQNGSALSSADVIAGTSNLSNRNEGWDLLPNHKRWSLVSTVRHNLSDRTQLFFDGLLSQRHTEYLNPAARQAVTVPESNPFYFNPSGQPGPVAVLYNFKDDLGYEYDQAKVTTANAAGGATMRIGEHWDVTTYASYSKAKDVSNAENAVNQTALAIALADPNPATAFNPFGDGSNTNPATLETIRDNVYGRRNATLKALNLTAEGVLYSFSDRDVRMAMGADLRWQALDSFFAQGVVPLAASDASRRAQGVYAEMLVPLVPENNGGYPGARSAQLSLAARHENYSDFGGATMPKIGLRYSPFQSLTLRTSWARSLKAPNFTDLDTSRNSAQIGLLPDPASPAKASYVMIWNGGNSELHEENAEIWTAGLEFTIPAHNLSIAAGYFNINFRDRIDQVSFDSAFLQDPIYSDIVTRNPSPSFLTNICNHATLIGASVGSCPSFDVPIAAVIDMRVANLAVLTTSGIDLQISHDLATRKGLFATRLSATYLLDYSRAQFEESPMASALNTPGNPVDLRVQGSLSWDHRGFGVTSAMNFINSYQDTSSRPSREIASWTTFDLQARYGATSGDRNRWNGASIALSVQNLLDKDPPFYNNPSGYGYDPSNADLLGRFVSFQLNKSW
jgi:outer membrane receptor protein involved in Fe transport